MLKFSVEADCCLIFLMPLGMIIDCLMLLLSSPLKEVINVIHALLIVFIPNWLTLIDV